MVADTTVAEPRRSGRVRKPVTTYADEYADQNAIPVKRLAADRMKDTASDGTASNKPAENIKNEPAVGDADLDLDMDEPDPAPKPRKRKAVVEDEAFADEASEAPKPKKRKSKAKVDQEPITITQSGRVIKHLFSKLDYEIPKSNGKCDTSWHQYSAESRVAARLSKIKPLKPGEKETRLKSLVVEPDDTYEKALHKADTERMYVLDRERTVEENCHAHHDDCPCERVTIAGSTGKVYDVRISHIPTCTCPVGIFQRTGQERCCKHVLYVLHNILKVSEDLKLQNAFLTSELKEIFANAPELPSAVVDADAALDGNRKPVEDDCPICCMEFDEEKDKIVWCRAACGNNIHADCFDKWAQTRPGNVSCVWCRAGWETDKPAKQTVTVTSVKTAERGQGGYRNVRNQLDYDD